MLEADQRALSSGALAAIVPIFPKGTAAAKLASGITALTKAEAVLAVTRFSADEERKRVFLEQSLKDLQANDPEQLLKQLMLRASRVRTLTDHIRRLETALADTAVQGVSTVIAGGRQKRGGKEVA